MQEDYLHYVWKFQAFERRALQTSAGLLLQVLFPGQHNGHAGPDFEQARVRVGATLWAGQVELHVRSSDWYRHGHHEDPAYRNVILHVVYEDDKVVQDASGNPLPTLVLAARIDHHHYWNYERLQQSGQPIPCAAHLGALDPFHFKKMIERTALERLEYRAKRWAATGQRYKGDWQASFHQALAAGFGLPLNRQPMEQLAQAMPFRHFKRLASAVERQAWAFGLSGLLAHAPSDPYVKELRRAFAFLQRKWSWSRPGNLLWKYARTRPANFPDLRLAQWLALLDALERPWDLHQMDGKGLNTLAASVAPDPYWQAHYRLGKASARHSAQMGQSAWRSMLINVLAPFRYLYGQKTGQLSYQEAALDLLSALPAEQNKITRLYQSLHLPTENALDSQGALELHRAYCSAKKCLNCGIGVQLLKPKNHD